MAFFAATPLFIHMHIAGTYKHLLALSTTFQQQSFNCWSAMDLIFSPAITKAKLKMDENLKILMYIFIYIYIVGKLAWFLETSPGVASDSFPFHWHASRFSSPSASTQNIVENQLVWDLLIPFLWWVLENGNSSELIASTQYKLHYVPVNQPHFDTGSTEINRNESKHVLFHSGKKIVNFIWWPGRFWCFYKAIIQ